MNHFRIALVSFASLLVALTIDKFNGGVVVFVLASFAVIFADSISRLIKMDHISAASVAFLAGALIPPNAPHAFVGLVDKSPIMFGVAGVALFFAAGFLKR